MACIQSANKYLTCKWDHMGPGDMLGFLFRKLGVYNLDCIVNFCSIYTFKTNAVPLLKLTMVHLKFLFLRFVKPKKSILGQHGTGSYGESEKSPPETRHPGSEQMSDASPFGYIGRRLRTLRRSKSEMLILQSVMLIFQIIYFKFL